MKKELVDGIKKESWWMRIGRWLISGGIGILCSGIVAFGMIRYNAGASAAYIEVQGQRLNKVEQIQEGRTLIIEGLNKEDERQNGRLTKAEVAIIKTNDKVDDSFSKCISQLNDMRKENSEWSKRMEDKLDKTNDLLIKHMSREDKISMNEYGIPSLNMSKDTR
jgi:hypothetical protein